MRGGPGREKRMDGVRDGGWCGGWGGEPGILRDKVAGAPAAKYKINRHYLSPTPRHQIHQKKNATIPQ